MSIDKFLDKISETVELTQEDTILKGAIRQFSNFLIRLENKAAKRNFDDNDFSIYSYVPSLTVRGKDLMLVRRDHHIDVIYSHDVIDKLIIHKNEVISETYNLPASQELFEKYLDVVISD